MKPSAILLTIILLAGAAAARAQDTAIRKVKWTRNLPAAVRSGWKNSKYGSWHIFGIHRLVTRTDTLYTIHVARYEAMGPDDAILAEEDRLYFSSSGILLKTQRL